LATIASLELLAQMSMNDFMERHAGALQLAFAVGAIGLALLLSLSLRHDAGRQTHGQYFRDPRYFGTRRYFRHLKRRLQQ